MSGPAALTKKVWRLVDLPKGKYSIGTKWVYRKKKDERGIVVRNKARLVAQASTLIETNKALLRDEEAEDVDVHLYRSMIGSLMYLTASRHDIMFVICAYARFHVTPKVSHLHVVKRIFRYFDYAGASLDKKSTTGGCQFLKKRLISWQSSTLIETNKALLRDEEAEDVDVHLYRSMIGSLMYLTASRHDIMFVICAYARFHVTPKVSHLHVVKRIFRYL
nr:hypothetical protein [Tanacetum cinerariifolium]